MKKIFLLLMLLIGFGWSISYAENKRSNGSMDEDEIYLKVDQKPEFPGGQTALARYLKNNIRRPTTMHENNIHGRVVCQFVVNKDGSLSDIEVVRSNYPTFNAEALRVIENMPRWEPGQLNGHPVRVRYTLPINFNLP
ncbi:MAG: energy transducer TonB [Paludibacteraceae bacterium]|jgi:protein TonB|nr:energy transducer TonB [Paludibacteraceae bacterium]